MTRAGPVALGLIRIGGCTGAYSLDALRGASTERGRAAIVRHECGACHLIPRIPAARGRVGPDLAGFARRLYVAGLYPNTPQILTRWIRDAPSLAPDTAMPNVGVDERDARDIAAYLYSLE